MSALIEEDKWTREEMEEAAHLLERALTIIAAPERWGPCNMAEMADARRSIREADRLDLLGAIAAASSRDMPLENWRDGHILYDQCFADGRTMLIADHAIVRLTLGRCASVEDVDAFVYVQGSPPFQQVLTHDDAHVRLREIVAIVIEELREAVARKHELQ